MSEKMRFVEKASVPGANISELCKAQGISRQTGHKWLKRYKKLGYGGLVEQSRRPSSSPLGTGEDIVVSVLKLRGEHPSWGPQKISRVLARTLGEDTPSKSTVARILLRLGKIKRRRPVVRLWTVNDKPYVEVKGPNDLWTIDFKGWWRAKNGERCEPLTVRDAFSRKVLAVTLVPNTRGIHVHRVLEQLFRSHGLPGTMQCDNGTPFIHMRARGGLTSLTVWLVSLGIRLIRSRPAHPEDNGGHERMHRDLSELELEPARDRRTQQRGCDRWMLDFNDVRPHEALGHKTPSEVYRDSKRRSLSPLTPTYPSEWTTRRVGRLGNISMNGDNVFVGTALARQIIGLKYLSGLRWQVHFFEVDLGEIEVAAINDVFSTTAGAAAVDVVNLQHERAQARADNGLRRTKSGKRRRARPVSRPKPEKRRAHASSVNG
jgi:transposase InsO family protein